MFQRKFLKASDDFMCFVCTPRNHVWKSLGSRARPGSSGYDDDNFCGTLSGIQAYGSWNRLLQSF